MLILLQAKSLRFVIKAQDNDNARAIARAYLKHAGRVPQCHIYVAWLDPFAGWSQWCYEGTIGL